VKNRKFSPSKSRTNHSLDVGNNKNSEISEMGNTGNTEKLYEFLTLKLIKPIKYQDLSDLCFSLFCTIEILPESIKPIKITKETLGLTFEKISFSNNMFEYSKNYWIKQIEKYMKLGKYPNLKDAQILLGTNK